MSGKSSKLQRKTVRELEMELRLLLTDEGKTDRAVCAEVLIAAGKLHGRVGNTKNEVLERAAEWLNNSVTFLHGEDGRSAEELLTETRDKKRVELERQALEHVRWRLTRDFELTANEILIKAAERCLVIYCVTDRAKSRFMATGLPSMIAGAPLRYEAHDPNNAVDGEVLAPTTHHVFQRDKGEYIDYFIAEKVEQVLEYCSEHEGIPQQHLQGEFSQIPDDAILAMNVPLETCDDLDIPHDETQEGFAHVILTGGRWAQYIPAGEMGTTEVL